MIKYDGAAPYSRNYCTCATEIFNLSIPLQISHETVLLKQIYCMGRRNHSSDLLSLTQFYSAKDENSYSAIHTVHSAEVREPEMGYDEQKCYQVF